MRKRKRKTPVINSVDDILAIDPEGDVDLKEVMKQAINPQNISTYAYRYLGILGAVTFASHQFGQEVFDETIQALARGEAVPLQQQLVCDMVRDILIAMSGRYED